MEEGPQGQYPPGWYQDPHGPGQRYWDGTQWTTSVQQQPASQESWHTSAVEFVDALGLLALAVVVVVVVVGLVAALLGVDLDFLAGE